MNENEILKTQLWRASIKKFDSTKKIPTATWNALEDSLILSPSSFGLQPWKFLVVESAEVKKKLTPLSWGQTQVEDCSHFVVFCYLNKIDEAYVQKFINTTAELRSLSLDKLEAYKNIMLNFLFKGNLNAKEWATKQVYIALGNFMTSAAALGVDTCPMEGINPPEFDKVLGLSGAEYSTVVACAAGYRHAEDAYSKLPKVRFSKKDLIQRF